MRVFIIYSIIIVMLCMAVILTRNYKRNEFEKLDKKQHTLKSLYGLSAWIFDFINHLHNIDLSNVKDKIGKIGIEKSDYNKAYVYVLSKLSISLLAFGCIAIIGYIKCTVDTFYQDSVVNVLERADYGEGDKEYRLNVIYNNGEREKVHIILPEQKYTEQKIISIFDECYESIINEVLGKNISEDDISYNLNLITDYDDKIEILWNIEENDYIDYAGNIHWDNIKGKKEMNLEMVLSMGEVSKSYIIPITINGEKRKNPDNTEDKITNLIKSSSEYEKEVILPKSIDKESVRFEEEKNETTLEYLIFAIMAGILLFVAKGRELQRIIKQRNEELEQDYVFIISKIAILHSAGINILSAWDKIIEDYNKTLDKNRVRYAYEEMKIARQKIKTGLSETAAYVEFGRRCGLHSYIKLGNLLEQNVRKGTKGLKEMLNQEVNEAYELRKVQARKKGDEAGTKLLLPMGIMLIISMVMIIVPAFISVNI